MTTSRPVIVTPAFGAAITDATIALAARIRALTGTTDSDSDTGEQDQAATIAADYITALMRHGWRPTNAQPLPDWHPPRRKPPPDVARRGAASARDLLSRTSQTPDEGNTR